MKVIIRFLKTKSSSRLYKTPSPVFLLVMAFLFSAIPDYGQDKKFPADSIPAQKKTVPDGTTGLELQVGPDDYLTKKRPPNEYEGTYSTLRLGFGYIADGATYSQNAVFKQQMDSAGLVFTSKFQTRDFRIMASGVSKIRRTISWKAGFMYDGDQKVWLLRETGLTIGVPEAFGHIFIGRTKEGYSMIKVMNGHSGITAERQMALDVIPILADGIKYFGYLPKSKIFWNLGYFNDFASRGQSFSTYAWQLDARVGWMPFYDKEKNRLLHIAANFRYGKPLDGKITLKSRPESNPAPQIINTGSFPTDRSTHIGAEFYYSTGDMMIGSEVMMHSFQSKDFEDHKFYGGDLFVSYLFTGAKRPYNTTSSIFGFVPVKKSVFKGGWGEVEGVLKISSLDLTDGSIQGGKFWRITPMINWYMSKIVRTEFVYGYGVLDRYNLKGAVQIFQVRLQLSVL
ncbi:MAG TPA: porin [Chitinophagaceae bacterium]